MGSFSRTKDDLMQEVFDLKKCQIDLLKLAIYMFTISTGAIFAYIKWLFGRPDLDYFLYILPAILLVIIPLCFSIINKTFIHKCRSIFRILAYIRLREELESQYRHTLSINIPPYEVAYRMAKESDYFRRRIPGGKYTFLFCFGYYVIIVVLFIFYVISNRYSRLALLLLLFSILFLFLFGSLSVKQNKSELTNDVQDKIQKTNFLENFLKLVFPGFITYGNLYPEFHKKEGENLSYVGHYYYNIIFLVSIAMALYVISLFGYVFFLIYELAYKDPVFAKHSFVSLCFEFLFKGENKILFRGNKHSLFILIRCLFFLSVIALFYLVHHLLLLGRYLKEVHYGPFSIDSWEEIFESIYNEYSSSVRFFHYITNRAEEPHSSRIYFGG